MLTARAAERAEVVRVPVALSIALAQLRHHRSRWALLALGIALVVAVPVVSAGLAHSVSAQTVRRTIAGLDVSDRTLLVSQELDSSLRRGSAHDNDVAVRAALAELTSAPVLRELLFRQLTVGGSSFFLGAVDDLPGVVRLTSGRLPKSCTPQRCEVVALGPAASTALRSAVTSLGVEVVGQVQRTNPVVVSGHLDPGSTPVLLGDSTDALSALAALELFARHYAWVSTVDTHRVVELGVPAYIRRGADLDQLLSTTVGGTTLFRPDEQLLAAQDRADTSARRFGLLGGFAAVLLLGFAVVAAVSLRAETQTLVRVLKRRGASLGQVAAVTVSAAVVITVVGAVAGLAGGGVGAAFLAAGTAHGPGGAALAAISSALITACLLTLAGAAVVVAVLVWPPAEARGVWRTVDVLALAGLGAAVLASDRGSATAESLAGRTDPIVIALPVLAALVAGLVAARLWQPAARLAERLLPARSVAGRVGLLGAIRRPLRPVATAAFLTAAIASVVFAGSYRATLLANDADQAAYRVPLDATLSPSSTVGAPLVPDVPSPGVHAYGVLRASASVTQLAGVAISVPVLGVAADALRSAHRWGRTTGSSTSASALADRLAVGTGSAVVLPPGTRSVAIGAAGYDPQTVVSLTLRTAGGLAVTSTLHRQGGELVGAVDAPDPGALRVVAISVAPSADYATHHGHTTGEGTSDVPLLTGHLTLGVVTANGARVPWTWAGWGSAAATITSSATQLRLGYRLSEAGVAAVPGFAATQALVLPVAVDRATAQDARGGWLVLAVDAHTTLQARVVAVLPRLPTVAGPFVLADRTALTTALDRTEPGHNPTQYWVSGSPSALDAMLKQPPYSQLSVVRRADVQHQLDADPVGRGGRLLLVLVALVELSIAAAALVLLVLGERRDGAGELYAWEADGTRPATLRRLLLVRTAAVAAVALPVGV
ncbi:MAG: hypothetical protein QOD45_1662, partial [Pseudonocardiales bacterium]|nr:hypothetical protein [Pseudonocardiales bacterium]